MSAVQRVEKLIVWRALFIATFFWRCVSVWACQGLLGGIHCNDGSLVAISNGFRDIKISPLIIVRVFCPVLYDRVATVCGAPKNRKRAVNESGGLNHALSRELCEMTLME